MKTDTGHIVSNFTWVVTVWTHNLLVSTWKYNTEVFNEFNWCLILTKGGNLALRLLLKVCLFFCWIKYNVLSESVHFHCWSCLILSLWTHWYLIVEVLWMGKVLKLICSKWEGTFIFQNVVVTILKLLPTPFWTCYCFWSFVLFFSFFFEFQKNKTDNVTCDLFRQSEQKEKK